jgi:hypothetical protein
MTDLEQLVDLKRSIGQMKNLASDAAKVQSVLNQLGIKLTDDQKMLIHNKLMDLDSTITSKTEEFEKVKLLYHQKVDTCDHDFHEVDFVTEKCSKCGVIRMDDELFYGDENL